MMPVKLSDAATWLAGVALTAGTLYLGTGLDPWWPLLWMAPLPVLLVAFRMGSYAAGSAALVAWVLGNLNVWSYLSLLVPIPVLIAFLLLPGAAFAAAVLASRRQFLRAHPIRATVALPAAWVAYEFIISLTSPHGSAASIAYTQVGFLPVIQIARLTGFLGIAFTVLLLPAGVAVAWSSRRRPGIPAATLAGSAGLVGAVLLYGWMRLASNDPGIPRRVALAASDTTVRFFRASTPEEVLPVVRVYTETVRQLGNQGVGIMVLAEKIVGVSPAYARDVYAELGGAARDAHLTLVAGLNLLEAPLNRNVAAVFTPEGLLATEYDKQHFIPGLEDGYTKGSEPGLFVAGADTMGVAICKDLDFPALGRRYSRAGARVLLVPAWDFSRDGLLHARMAILRGVEGGFALVRSAQDGLLTITDSRGRVLASAASNDAPVTTLVGEVLPGPAHTFYSRTGDWLGWLSVGLTVALQLSGRRSTSSPGRRSAIG